MQWTLFLRRASAPPLLRSFTTGREQVEINRPSLSSSANVARTFTSRLYLHEKGAPAFRFIPDCYWSPLIVIGKCLLIYWDMNIHKYAANAAKLIMQQRCCDMNCVIIGTCIMLINVTIIDIDIIYLNVMYLAKNIVSISVECWRIIVKYFYIITFRQHN